MAPANCKFIAMFVSAACLFNGLFTNGQSQPNIVYILVDDLGYNDIGYHAKMHNSDVRTPFLDAMAAQGIKLENYYVQPRCTPTRSQLLTGRYDIHTGLQHAVIYTTQANAVPTDMKLLPEQLQGCGYDTHMVGKWHLGFYKDEVLPWNRGFRSFFRILSGGCDHFTRVACSSRSCGTDMWSSKEGPVNNTFGEYSAHLYARKAIEAIDKRDITKPLFLYLSYQSVHTPIQVPEEYANRYRHIKDIGRRTYAGMVAALDESIQNVTTHLSRVGMLENTIIVFSTDNGAIPRRGGNNWPFRGGKATLWEGGMKAVGFLYGTPLGLQGVTHNGLLHVSDWFPTLMRVASCKKLSGTQPLDGHDQWDSIRQKTQSARTEILHSIDPKFRKTPSSGRHASSGFDTRIRAAIRIGPWKLITGNPGNPTRIEPPEYLQRFGIRKRLKGRKNRFHIKPDIQLFHVESDHYEQEELSAKFPGVVDRLLARLAEFNATSVPVRFPRSDLRAEPWVNRGFWGPWVPK